MPMGPGPMIATVLSPPISAGHRSPAPAGAGLGDHARGWWLAAGAVRSGLRGELGDDRQQVPRRRVDVALAGDHDGRHGLVPPVARRTSCAAVGSAQMLRQLASTPRRDSARRSRAQYGQPGRQNTCTVGPCDTRSVGCSVMVREPGSGRGGIPSGMGTSRRPRWQACPRDLAAVRLGWCRPMSGLH